MFLELHGGDCGFLYLIDIIIANHKLYRRFLFEDLDHLAFECVFPADLLHVQFTVGAFLQPCDEVETTHPDGVLLVAIDHRDAPELRSMDHTPPGTVEVDQSLEVCYEHRPVLANLDIVVPVVSAIFRRCVVPDQGQAL